MSRAEERPLVPTTHFSAWLAPNRAHAAGDAETGNMHLCVAIRAASFEQRLDMPCRRPSCLADGGACSPAAEKGRVRPMAALYLLERMFHVMTDGKLLNPLIAALMGGGCGGGRGGGAALMSLSEDAPVSPPGGVQMWDPKEVTHHALLHL